MPKSLLAQLQEAAAAGDIEKVQKITKKMAETQKPKAVKKPKVKVRDIILDEVQTVELDPEMDYSNGFTTSAKRSNFVETVVDEDGVEHRRSKIVPFKPSNKKNSFVDNGGSFAKDADIDKKLHKYSTKSEYRQSVKQVKIVCTRCNNSQVVWPGEIMNANYVCDKCLLRNKRDN
jgi:hypothetical protein